MLIPQYPLFAQVSLDMKAELYPAWNMLLDGVSEFTFAGVYLFRNTYKYQLSRLDSKSLVVSGQKNGENFFFSPCGVPSTEKLEKLFSNHLYLKNMPETYCKAERLRLEEAGYEVREDRDNFDYTYTRTDLAELAGKTYHKKRNLVNAFLAEYSYEQRKIDASNVKDALSVLDAWRIEKNTDGDYIAATEALTLHKELGLRGFVYYVHGKPAAYVLGEPLAKAKMFAVHFEKAISQYKGIYQLINQAFAQSLPNYIQTINREQDLGDEGLRQAKMTYRPSGFVKKYRVYKATQK